MVLINLTDSLSTPVAISIQATGKVKVPQLITGSILIAILPVSYIALKIGAPAETVFWIHLSSAIIAQISRVVMLKNRTSFSVRYYFKEVISPILSVVVIVALYSYAVFLFFYNETILSLLGISVITCSINIVIFYSIGMDRYERSIIREKAYRLIRRYKK